MWSQRQPKIDKNNRFRQDILAIEERFVTKSFPFRMFTTVLGITFANAFEWYGYFVQHDKYDCFLTFMRDLSFDAMHNEYDTLGARPTPGVARTAGSSSPQPFSPRARAKLHCAVPLKSLPGYTGAGKQVCTICNDNNHKTTLCCLHCSTPERVFAIHREQVCYGGQKIVYDCLKKHREDPDCKMHQDRRTVPTGRKRGRKRTKPACHARNQRNEDSSSDDSCDFM